MDLKGLGGGGTWKGFSDNELQTLKKKPASQQVPAVKSRPDPPPPSVIVSVSTSPSVPSQPRTTESEVLENELRIPSAEQSKSRLSVNEADTDK